MLMLFFLFLTSDCFLVLQRMKTTFSDAPEKWGCLLAKSQEAVPVPTAEFPFKIDWYIMLKVLQLVQPG